MVFSFDVPFTVSCLLKGYTGVRSVEKCVSIGVHLRAGLQAFLLEFRGEKEDDILSIETSDIEDILFSFGKDVITLRDVHAVDSVFVDLYFLASRLSHRLIGYGSD